MNDDQLREVLEDMVARRTEHTGETRQEAIDHILHFATQIAEGKLKVVQLPGGSALLVDDGTRVAH